MFSRFCKNTIFPTSTTNNSSSTSNTPAPRYHHQYQSRQLPDIPNNSQGNSRGPPPPYSPRTQEQQYQRHINPRVIEIRHAVPRRVNNNPNVYSSSSDSDNANNIINVHELRRIPTTRNNAFCPDLVRHCTTTATTQNDDEDYICIDDTIVVNENFSRLSLNQPPPSISLSSTGDQLVGGNNQRSNQINHENSRLTNSSVGEVMGQNLSLRRPKISLTWVLREQQTHSNNTTTGSKTNSLIRRKNSLVKKSSTTGGCVVGGQTIETKKKKNRDEINEKLFSEKYVNHEKNNPQNNLGLTLIVPPHIHTNGGVLQQQITGPEKFRELRKSDRSRGKSKFERNKNLLGPSNQNHYVLSSNQSDLGGKSNYSEPSVYTTVSDGAQKRHRPRKRKERHRSQRFGYDIKNVDEFLSRCSLTSPANIPVVLSSASTLYQTRPGGYQIEIPLPLGMVVNAIFKNQNWLYVQTPHAEEGYVAYTSCLPLGILPPTRSSPTSRPPPCWENSGDVFPKPCGNMTDSEKEIHLRGGTRSEGARTPKLRRSKMCNEKNVDALYLRAASQPKLTDKCYAQLKPTNKYKINHPPPSVAQSEKSNDDYISIHQQKFRAQHRHYSTSVVRSQKTITPPPIVATVKQTPSQSVQIQNNQPPPRPPRRHTLLAITENYMSDSISVNKGDVVILLACQDSKAANIQQWFYVRTRDNVIGYIPADVAGHGFL